MTRETCVRDHRLATEDAGDLLESCRTELKEKVAAAGGDTLVIESQTKIPCAAPAGTNDCLKVSGRRYQAIQETKAELISCRKDWALGVAPYTPETPCKEDLQRQAYKLEAVALVIKQRTEIPFKSETVKDTARTSVERWAARTVPETKKLSSCQVRLTEVFRRT